MNARVTFKWLHIPLTSRQTAVIHHMTGWCVWPWIQLLCEICGCENGHDGCHLAGFSEDIAFAHHFMATRLPPLLPYRSASGIGYASKNYLKWWETQLAIHQIVDEQIDYKQLQNCGKLHISISFSFRVIILKILIIGICKDF